VLRDLPGRSFPSISQMKTLRRWQSFSRLRASRTWKCAVPTPQLPILLFTRKSPELAGIVRDYENRKPLRRAELVLTRVDDPRITSHAVADDQGGFRFENLAAGCYDLRISRPGYLPAQVKTLLVPHENSVAVDVPMSRDDKKLIVCQ